jgi:Tol biopolymer transport system component
MGRCVLPAALLAAASMLFATAAQAGTFPGRNGAITFGAPVAGLSQVFTMRPNGRGVKQVTHDPLGASDPDWTSDGRNLLYSRSNGRAAFGAATLVTDEPIGDPSVSPDGKMVVFTTNDGVYDGPSIYVAGTDGSGQHRLVPGSKPHWSGDGHWIAYVSIPAETGCPGVNLMQPDGSDNHPVAAGQPDAQGVCRGGGNDPSFSSDSRKVVFVSTGLHTQHSSGGSDIFTVSIHGGGRTRLTHDDLTETTPVYSPDGKRIVFATGGGKGRRNGTWTISAAGKHRHRIGPPRGALSWQPLPAG